MFDVKRTLLDKTINLIVYDEPNKGTYHSAVDIIAEKTFSIIAPNKDGTTLLLPKGTKVTVTFWDDIRAYMFEAELISRSNVPIPIFVLTRPEKLIEIQRRDFVRIETFLPLHIQKIGEGVDENMWFRASTLDLSGGGLRLTTVQEIEKEDALRVKLALEGKEIKILTRVCRVTKNKDTGHYEAGLQFMDLSERERDNIIRYIFQLQISMRKKGLV